MKFLQILFHKCELAFRQEGFGFQFSAKGPVAVLAATLIAVLIIISIR